MKNKNNSGVEGKKRQAIFDGLTPNDQAMPALQAVYGDESDSEDINVSREDRKDGYHDANKEPSENSGTEDGEITDTDYSPVAEEGTPVDPVAPPINVVNGIDLINGAGAELLDEDEEQR